MKIAVVNNFYPPRVGGSSHMAQALAAGYAQAGHEVIVLTAEYKDAPKEELTSDGVRVVRLPSWTLPSVGLEIDFDISFTTRPKVRKRVNTLLDEFQPDVIHQHGQFLDLAWWTGAWARRHDVPVLLSIHTRLESADWKFRFIFRNLDRFMVKPAITRFHPRYVIMDKMAATYCEERYGATTADFEYIPVPVDPDRFTVPKGKATVERFDLQGSKLILSLGHVIPLRNRLPLINAMPRVLAAHPEAKVLVVGHVYFDAFIERSRELGIEQSVLSIGAVPKDDVPAFFAAADVVAHDLHGLGCGTASLEAMAAGVPTIATVDADNFPMVELRNWENAILVPPDDPGALAETIIKILDDPELAEKIGAAQQKLVHEYFTMDVVVKQHLDTFERMLDSKRK